MSEIFSSTQDRFSVAVDIARTVAQDAEIQRIRWELNAFSRNEAQVGFFATRGILRSLPISYLWGIQGPGEYSNGKRKRVESLLAANGMCFLQERPVSSVLVPSNSDTWFAALVDGHNRARYAPKFGIRHTTTHIVSLSQLAEHLSCNTDTLADVFIELASCAIGNFQKINPKVATPYTITGTEIDAFGLQPLL